MVKHCARRRDASSSLSTPLHFTHTSLGNVKPFIWEHHYSHTVPAGVTDAFALYWRGGLAGAALYGFGPGNPKAYWGFPNVLFRELTRVALLDEVPRNAESMFVAWTLRQMHKLHPELIAIISYADPAHGHSGIIYRASNWRYLGQFKAHRGTGRGPYSPIPKHKFVFELHLPAKGYYVKG